MNLAGDTSAAAVDGFVDLTLQKGQANIISNDAGFYFLSIQIGKNLFFF
jgi:hypothetical protein